MKRRVSLLMILVLCLLLAAPSLAAEDFKVQVSAQKLTADGVSIDCEKYNIDGSNYFKLRDVAMLLRGTPAAFGVSFDTEGKTVFAEKGAEYEPIGTELVAGEDRSDTCVPSVWKLYVDGELAEVSTYNIGGSNFYKLRDLGSVIGFAVDYDPESNTAFIFSDYLHTAVTAGKDPFGEVVGWTYSEPAEQHPWVTIYYDGAGEVVGGAITDDAPVITRSVSEDGSVTYRAEVRETCAIRVGGIDDIYRFADNYGFSFSGYHFYDSYTGACFYSRVLTGNDSVSETLLLAYHGKTWPCAYRSEISYDASDLWLEENGDISIEFTALSVLTVTVPADYDGLALALRCSEPEVVHEVDLESKEALNGVDYWEDDPAREQWVFIRAADWAQDAD